MGELEKYGLLSLGSVAVLFLVLTFVHRDLESKERRSVALAGPEEPVVLLAAPPASDPPPGSAVPSRAGAAAEPPSRPAPRAVAADDVAPVARAPVPRARLAPPPREEPPAVEDGPPRVVVREGDTLYAIAERELGEARRWPEIVALNGHLDPARLRVGAELILPRPPPPPARRPSGEPPPRRATKALPAPSARSHRIEDGDTLSGIALRYYGDARLWDRILQANRARIDDPRRLRIGTVLNLP